MAERDELSLQYFEFLQEPYGRNVKDLPLFLFMFYYLL